MTERQVNDRRNWKAETFPYDYYIPDGSNECLYCLTDKQSEILRGIIEPLGWHTRWWSDSDTEIDPDAIQAFRDDLIRRLMMSCCGDELPVQWRYTSDGVLQRSDDGGATWNDAPGYDPRNYSPQFPPAPGDDGDDKKCIAATGAAALIKEQVGEQLTDDMTRYTLAQLITDWVKTYIQTSNPFEALLTVIANQIFALVIAVLRPALTDEVYDTLKCILYCNMSDDASFTDSQWVQVRSDITEQITGIAGVFFEHLVYLLGAGGLTNVARAGGAASGDCSVCECSGNWCLVYDFTTSDYDIPFSYGSYSPGVGIVGTPAGTGVSIVGNIDWNVTTNVTYCSITLSGSGQFNNYLAGNDGTEGIFNGLNQSSDTYVAEPSYTQTPDTAIVVNPSSGASQGANVTMTRLEFRGTGDMPPGATAC